MARTDYSNREIDIYLRDINDTLSRIETQTVKTNGRVNRLERNLTIVACVVGTILIMKFPEVIKAIQLFI